MDVAALPIGLAATAFIALAVLVHGIVRRAQLSRALERAWHEVPLDHATGLFDRRACMQRVAAEINRARRGSGTVWLGVVTVTSGDPDRFGRLLHDSLRVPEVGFRLADCVVCIARPGLTPAERDDLLGRIVAAAPRERLALGEATWESTVDGDAARLLQRASAEVREVAR